MAHWFGKMSWNVVEKKYCLRSSAYCAFSFGKEQRWLSASKYKIQEEHASFDGQGRVLEESLKGVWCEYDKLYYRYVQDKKIDYIHVQQYKPKILGGACSWCGKDMIKYITYVHEI